jgi:hypothetical protein
MTPIEEESDMDIIWVIAGIAFFGISAGAIRFIDSLKAGE